MWFIYIQVLTCTLHPWIWLWDKLTAPKIQILALWGRKKPCTLLHSNCQIWHARADVCFVSRYPLQNFVGLRIAQFFSSNYQYCYMYLLIMNIVQEYTKIKYKHRRVIAYESRNSHPRINTIVLIMKYRPKHRRVK